MADNVLLIVIDQLRADCLLGNLADAAPLPNLLALMRESTCFEQHYTVTTPCGPSRASLLTGLYAMNHRSIRNGTPLSKQHPTIAHHMRKAGYEPMLFGYTDTSADPNDRHSNDPDLKTFEGLAPGFAEMVRLRQSFGGAWWGYLKANGYDLPENYWDVYTPSLDNSTASERFPNGSPIRSKALYSAEHSDTAFLTDRTIETLSGMETQQWFALLTYVRPHPPLVAPAPFNAMYDPATLPAPVRGNTLNALASTHPFYDAFFSKPTNHGLYNGFNGEIAQMTDDQIAELRAVYLGLAFEVDLHIGRVIQYLKDTKQYDNTLIVVTADHGEMLGDQWLWGKIAPHDAALHIPLLVRDPRKPNSFGRQISAFTESIDIAPTLVDWTATSQEKKSFTGFDGMSLLPLLSDTEPKSWRKHVFCEAELGDPMEKTPYQSICNLDAAQSNFAMLQSSTHKYVHFNGGQSPMLFDLKTDSLEHHNIAGDPGSTGLLNQMCSMMIDHRMTHANSTMSQSLLTANGLFPK